MQTRTELGRIQHKPRQIAAQVKSCSNLRGASRYRSNYHVGTDLISHLGGAACCGHWKSRMSTNVFSNEQGAVSMAVSHRSTGHVSKPRLRTALITQASRGYASTSHSITYLGTGPHDQVQSKPITVKVGGDDELPITATFTVTLPKGTSGPVPLVLLSGGFLLRSSLYASYATHLASWGFAVATYDVTSRYTSAVATYDVSEAMDDKGMVDAMKHVIKSCGKIRQLQGKVDMESIALLGHSRGAKLSCLLAAESDIASKIKALLLLDPVNNTAMTPVSPGYPDALPSLLRATSTTPGLPVLIVGAGSAGDIVPDSANYKRFMAVSKGPVWCVELHGSGHLAFLDEGAKGAGLFSFFSSQGSTPDRAVWEASKVAIMTWLDMVFPDGPSFPKDAIQDAETDIRKIVSNECDSTVLRLEQLKPRASAWSSDAQSAGRTASSATSSQTSQSSNGSTDASGSSQQHQESKQSKATTTMSFDELMQLRAKVLKSMLQERGIPCDDVFEKDQLARRLLAL